MKKVLILAGSPRVNGNSSALSNEFARGAMEAGHSVEKIDVARKKVSGCLGCNGCYRNGGVCVQKDDAGGRCNCSGVAHLFLLHVRAA